MQHLQPESRLLTFLPEQHELQHTLQLLHKLSDPGLHAVTQLPGPDDQQLSQRLCAAWPASVQVWGLRLPDLHILLHQRAGQLGIQGPGCRVGRGSGGHRGHLE